MADRIGKQLGNYRLTHLLGHGGYAEVYLGEHIYLKTQTAIKVVDAHLAGEHLQTFLVEARTIARLIHPHIVRVLEFGVEEGAPFLVMDYASHGTMRARYLEGTRLPLPTILPYLRQIAAALEYAHGKQIIHRDIKPANLLLGEDEQILLSDFGIAVMAHTAPSKDHQPIAGTAAYMAPEQLEGKPRFASDQYSLGIVVYEWLSGERPFQGNFTELVAQQIIAPPPSLRAKIPSLSAAVEQVVLRALAKDYKARFASVQAFVTALEDAAAQPAKQYLGTSGPLKRPTPPPAAGLAAQLPIELATTHRLQPSAPEETDLLPGTTVAVYDHKNAEVLALAWSPDGKRLASTGAGGVVQVWQVATQQTIASYRGHRLDVLLLAWSPDGKRLASVGANGTIRVWDARKGAAILTYRGHSQPVNALAWSPDGKRLASAGQDQVVQVWDAFTGERLFPLHRNPTPVSALIWLRDGKRLTAVSRDGTLQTWNAATNGDLLTTRSHSVLGYDEVRAPDGDLLATIKQDQTVEVRDAANGRHVLTYRGHIGLVRVIAWSPDGRCIASGGADRTVRVWQVRQAQKK